MPKSTAKHLGLGMLKTHIRHDLCTNGFCIDPSSTWAPCAFNYKGLIRHSQEVCRETLGCNSIEIMLASILSPRDCLSNIPV